MAIKRLLVFLLLVTSLVAQQKVTQGLFPSPTVSTTNLTNVMNAEVVKLLVVTIGWRTIESDTVPGSYNWAAQDTIVNALHAAYPTAKIEPIYAPASDLFSNSFTPHYVMADPAQHVCWCASYAGDKPGVNQCYLGAIIPPAVTPDYTGIPVMFDAPAQNAWNNFLAASVAYDKTAYAAGLIFSAAYGVQKGAENFPVCSPLQQTLAGGTEAQLETTWQSINDTQDDTVATALGAKPWPFTPFNNLNCLGNTTIPSTSNHCSLADKEAIAHAKWGIGLRTTCIANTDLINYSQNTPTCGDAIALFQKYPLPKDIQEGGESSPTGQGTNCPNNWTTLLPFVQQHWGPGPGPFIHEGLANDWYGVFSSSYTTDPCWPRSGTGATTTPWGPYKDVLTNMTLGLPQGNSNLIGPSYLIGNGSTIR